MMAAAGYSPISEVAFKARQIEGFDRAVLHGELTRLPIFTTGKGGVTRRLDVRVLAQHGGRYAFIDENSWTICVDALASEAQFNRSPTETGHGSTNFPGGLTQVDLAYDEQLRNALGLSRRGVLKRYLAEISVSEDADEMLESLEVNDILALDEINGSALFLNSDVVGNIISCIEQASPQRGRVIRDTDQLRREFAEFISRPTSAAQRDQWGSTFAPGGRDRARKLWREMKPEGGSKSGPKGVKRD